MLHRKEFTSEPQEIEMSNSLFFFSFPEEKDVFVECLNFLSLSLKQCYWQARHAFPVLTEECQVAAKDGKEQRKELKKQ